MKNIIVFILFFCSTTQVSLAQRKADLNQFAKNKDIAAGPISDIDSLSKILTKKFIHIANDTTTKTHKDIQDFFESYRGNPIDTQNYIYPKNIQAKHLTIQFLNYTYAYGFVGETMDSAFNSTVLDALVLIPAFDDFHKGTAVNTLCFKVTLEMYSEGNLTTNKDYKREDKITKIKLIDMGD